MPRVMGIGRPPKEVESDWVLVCYSSDSFVFEQSVYRNDPLGVPCSYSSMAVDERNAMTPANDLHLRR